MSQINLCLVCYKNAYFGCKLKLNCETKTLQIRFFCIVRSCNGL